MNKLTKYLFWSKFLILPLYLTFLIYTLLSDICFTYYGIAGSGPFSRCEFLPTGWLEFIIKFKFVPIIIALLAGSLLYLVLKRIFNSFKKWEIHIIGVVLISLLLEFLLFINCIIKFDPTGNPYSTCAFLSYPQIIYLNDNLIFSYTFFLLVGFFAYLVVYSTYKFFNMDYKRLHDNIFNILNVSLAVFFVSWQLIYKFCGKWIMAGKGGDAYVSKCPLVPTSLLHDSLVITTFYLIVLSLVIFLFLIASERFYQRVKDLRLVFLVINIIFIFTLFFEF